jgi:hypothetical protein
MKAGLARSFRLTLLAFLLGGAARAQTAAPVAPAAAEPVVSPRLVRLFRGAPPKYHPPTASDTATAPAGLEDQPRNDIVRLPLFLVRETRPLAEEDLLTESGREAAMARRYLGPQGDLDRYLNTVTLDGLWKSIPILGRIPFIAFGSLTYNQRAVLFYDDVERKRRLGELMDIELLARKAGNAKSAAKPSK